MKNLQRGFVVPILIVIIALLVIGGGVYIYENEKVEVPVVADNTTQQSSQAQQTNNRQNSAIIKTNPVSSAVPDKSSLTVSSPNGQEVWVNGSKQIIRWTSEGSDASQPVNIFLERKSPNDTQFWNIDMIATNQPGSGSYTWTVSSKDTTGNIVANAQYKILIGRNIAKGLGPVDESDDYFLISTPIAQPSITVLYPNYGEVLNNGGRDNIATVRWTTSNFGNMNVTIGLLSKNGDWIKTIASDVPNTGNFNWRTDPTIASGEYKISVTSSQSITNSGPVVADSSDDTFVISTRSIIPGKTFVTLVSPNGGEILNVGDKLIIKWSSLGEKPTSATISLRSNARCPYGYNCSPPTHLFANIAEISGNDLDKGEYEWIVSKSNVDNSNNQYLIGIMISKDNLGNASYDDSDFGFTIN